jgi:hypothetical protein
MVVGIDVDKEDFDKYSVKKEVEELLRHFAKTPDYMQAIEEVGAAADMRNFLPALLENTLSSLDAGFEALREVRLGGGGSVFFWFPHHPHHPTS